MIPPALTEKLDKAEEISRKACMSYTFHPVWQSHFSQRATHYQTVKKMLEWILSLAFFLLDWFTMFEVLAVHFTQQEKR